jgi:diguanylate cyclase (GGDEF)-like protein
VQDIKSDFESQNGGLIEFEDNNENTYLVYEPLGRNGWMLCYCLPASKAKEEYHFIVKYEMYLAAYMLLVVAAFFVWVMFQNVKRQRAIIVYANTDALTGICNKKNTENRIEEWLQHPDCKGTQAFLMFDIDNFKQINDSYGHSAGDAVLHQIGSLMRSYFREGDIVGRVGGDEFVVLMKNVNSPEDAVYRARTLATKMRNIKIRGFEDTVVTCSMGLAFSPENGIAYRDLYGCADEALYVTKGNGRDGCTIYKKQFD